MDFLKEYWPIITTIVTLIFVLGKIWQNIKHLCVNVAGLQREFKDYKYEASQYCKLSTCDRIRQECLERHDKIFAEIKHSIEIMDAKRESSRDDAARTLKETNDVLSDISCRLGRIEGRLTSMEK